MTFFAERKCRPKEQEPQTTSTGKAYIRKNVEAKNQMMSPVPVMIAPTDQGNYECKRERLKKSKPTTEPLPA